MKKTTRTARKVLSVFLSVLMILTTLTVAAPGLALAAGSYYVRVYLNIYDGADDGYFYDYKVTTDQSSTFYGKPDDYKWSGNSISGSKGYTGSLNMAGFTLFYNNGTSYVTEDLKDELYAFQTNNGKDFYTDFNSNGRISVAGLDAATNYEEHIYGFVLPSIPTELFWLIDSYTCINDSAYAVTKITVAANDQAEEYTLWSGYTGSESRSYCYYGSITPEGTNTCYGDYGSSPATYYLDYTTSNAGIWSTTSVPTSVKFDNNTAINYTIPKLTADDSSSYYSRSATVYDQYGVAMDLTPTSYYVTDASGNVLNSDALYYSNGKLYVKKEAQKLYPGTESNTFYLVADYNGLTDRIQLNLTNPEYDVTYYNLDDIGVLFDKGVYGEVIPSPAVSFYSTNDNSTHYVHTFPATVTVEGDTHVKLVAATEPHNITAYTTITEATYEAPGEEQGTCTKCNATVTREIPQLTDGNAPVITLTGNGNAESAIFCGDVNVAVADSRTFTLAVTKDGEDYAVADTAGFTLTEAGTYVITATDASNNVATKTVTINAAHTVESWTSADENNHSGTCTVCGETVTESHTFVNPVLTRPTQNTDGTWTDGYYTYTCVCGETKTEPAVRADYSELEEAVEALEEIKNNENLSDEAKAVIEEALKDANDLADDLVTAEQDKIDALVKELKDIKADADEAIKNKELGVNDITEATSGVKVQFIDASGLGTIDSVQLGEDEGFIIRVANGNADSDITVTGVSGVATEAKTLEPGKSADYRVEMPAAAGIYEYAITYTIDGLKNADGSAVTATTKAYLYVKAAAYVPHHYMDEKVGVGSETSEWDFYLESTNYGDFVLVHDNKAPYDAFGNTNLVQDGAGLFDYVREQYDYENDGCYAGCADGTYDDGDAHAATYRYYIDTSLAPTYEAAGLRASFVENEAGYYHNAPLKYVRLANNQAYLDKISGDDKTFSVTFLPSSSGTQGMTWTATSNGDMTVSQYDNPDQNNYIFGYHHPDEGCEETTAYANFSGAIPTATEEAKLMFSPRMEFNGPNIAYAEATTMTTHLYITSYDKADLRDAVTAAETAGYNSAYFDAEKYEAYEEALANAKEVLGKAETNQAEVDAAKDALNTAIDNLAAAEAKFVLTVTHSIHENADKNSEATDTLDDYYLVNGDVTPALKADVIAKDTINKYDTAVTLTVTADTAHTYNYWYIDYSGVEDAINAADAIINDTTSGYTDEYKAQVEEAKKELEEINKTNSEDSTTAPESQADVKNAIDAVTALTGHECNKDVVIPGKAATCDETGLTEGAKCSVCGKITKAQTETSKAAHTPEVVDGKDATCTETGLTEGSKCSVCGETLVEQTVTAALGHEFSAVVTANAATCLAPGNVAYKQCTVCKLYFAADAQANATDGKADTTAFTLAQLAHAYTGEFVWYNSAEPYTHAQKCVNGCGKANPETTECTFETTTEAPTCTEGGTITHTCTVCKNSYETYTSANGHTWNEGALTRPELVDGAWVDGYYTYTCEACGTTKTEPAKRADYTAYDEAKTALEALLADETLTTEAKTEIENLLEDNKIADNLIASEQDKVNAAAAALKAEVEKLTNEDGTLKDEYKKPDYTEWDKAETAYDALTEEELANVKTEIIEEAEALKAEIAAKEADETLTQATATQEDIDEATARLNEIVAGINDGTLVKPDYSGAEEAIEDAKEVADSENIPDDTEAEIEAEIAELEEQLNEIKDSNPSSTDEEVNNKIAEIEQAAKDIIDTYGECAKGNHTDVETDGDHNCDICGKLDVTSHNYVNPQLTRPVYDEEKGEWSDGYYTSTCNCGDTSETTIARADYEAYDKAVADLNALLETGKLTQTAVDMINAALEANDILDDYVATSEEQDIVDDAAAALKVTLGELTDENGLKKEYEKVDYSKYEAAVNAYENLKNTMTDADKTAVEEIKAEIAEIPADGTAAQYQTQVDKAAEDIAKINAKYGDCATGNHKWGEPVLTKVPTETIKGEYTETCGICGATRITEVERADYDKFDEAVKALEELAKTKNLTDTAKAAIEEALEKAENLDKNLPADVTTVDGKEIKGGQDKIDALVTELNGVVADTKADIADGSALKPDYTEWDEAKTAYDALDKTNVKGEIIAEADALKAEIAEKQADDTLTQATATQVRINEATARLNEIVAGINDGSLKDPDYSAVEEKITDAKDNDNLNKDTQDKIKDIEDALEEIKNRDPKPNAKDDQDEVDALEEQLDEILDSIADGKATAPDYTEWDEAEGTYDALDKTNVPVELVSEATNLKAVIAALKADDTANAAEDQQTINDATTRLNEIITEINGILTEKPDYSGYEASREDYEELVEQYGDKIKDSVAGDVAGLDAIVNGVRNDETATKVDDQPTVDNAKTQLDAIIAGIKDGSLIKPADFKNVNEDLETAKDLASSNDVIDDVNKNITNIEKAIDDLEKDTTTNATSQPVIDALEKQLEAIIDGINDGTLVKPDLDDAKDDLADAKDKAEKNDVIDGVKEDIAELEKALENIENDSTATKADDQDDVEAIEKALEDIIAGIEDGSLVKPNYSEAENAITNAESTGSMTDADKEALEDLKDKLDEIKNDPTSNYKDDQGAVDSIKDAVQDIVDKYAECKLGNHAWGVPELTKKPTADAKGEYTHTCTVCGETKTTEVELANYAEFNIVVEALEALLGTANLTDTAKAAIEEALEKAENLDKNLPADVKDGEVVVIPGKQGEIDALVTELEKVVADTNAGIADGSLVKPDYTEVDKDLADAKDKAENNNVIDGVKDDIKEIEDALNNLKDDPKTNKAEHQDDVDALEDQLEAIIDGINDGSLVKPDYTEADKAIEDAEDDIDGGKLSDEDQKALDELKDKLDEIKNDPTSNYKDDQGAVDSIKDAVQEIVDRYSECAKGNHAYETKTVLPTCTEKGYDLHTCKVCAKTYKDNYVDETGHIEVVLEAVEPTCSSVGLTEGKKCEKCGTITVAQEEIPMLRHTDADGDGVCDVCGKGGLYDGCTCLCHNNHWFWRLVYLIIRIIWRVFRIHQICPCGAVHF